MSSAAQPLHVAPSVDDGLALRYYTVTSGDGTELQAWTNDVDGPTVLLCNGLGTNPYSWPALLDPDCGVRVISWNHRGTGGSERPVDTEHVGIDAFAEDAIAVLDDAGIDACVLMGWSMGVNTMFEVAVTLPRARHRPVRGRRRARATPSPRCWRRSSSPARSASRSPSTRPAR